MACQSGREGVKASSVAILALGSITVLVIGWVVFTPGSPPVPPPLPNPNGYDDLVQAGLAIVGEPRPDEERTLKELHAFVQTNAPAFALIQTGLARQCCVPVKFSDAWMRTHFPELPAIKTAAYALMASGRLAELDRDFPAAAKAYLDCITLAAESSRGGLLVDRVHGATCEALGSRELFNIVPELDAATCSNAVQVLKVLESRRESDAEVMALENKWTRATQSGFGYWRRRLVEMIRNRTLKPASTTDAQLLRKANQRELQTVSLMVALALRTYELEKGQPPQRLEDLVPEFLEKVPLNPVTGTNITWNP